MRDELSRLIVEYAKSDSNVIVLTGDHGYALFDDLRRECPKQFINCGIIEQAMVGIASGLAQKGFKPIVYGLASFVPMRCLEQIKLDICYPNLPVMFLGDGAGLVYSTLGASHHCAEDIAVLMPMPNISIYSPADAVELEDIFTEAKALKGPSYLRIGKSDRPLNRNRWGGSTDIIVSTGSMSQIGEKIAYRHGIEFYSACRLKPTWLPNMEEYRNVFILEEHGQCGGLGSMVRHKSRCPIIHSFSLKDKFADKCGSWQYALSEHGISDDQLREWFDGFYSSNGKGS